MKSGWLLVAIAAIFWFILFSPWTSDAVPFWWGMFFAAGCLAIAALIIDRRDIAERYAFKPKYIAIGLASALLLYLIFLIGDKVATFILPFSRRQIESVYSTRSQASPLVIAALLLFWIGPAEEIFWRGFLQKRLMVRYGEWEGVALGSLVYAGVHIWSLNAMLFMTAFLCGLFWGALYRQYKSLWLVIISHAVWDVIIFVILPIR
jgi:membrane protease YdiL (CAAX protease family)